MKPFLLLPFTFFLFPFTLFSQNTAPVVSNITVTEQPNCTFMVNIRYDVLDAEGDAMTLSMQVSNDNGTTWNYPFNPANVTGAIGTGITSGQNKLITWNFGADHPNTLLSNIKVKIIADDGVISGPGVPCPGMPSFTYGGQLYHTVQIGTQCWMKENLNIGTMINVASNQTNNSSIEKYCYNNDPANCTTYGGLYQWNEMMQYVTSPGVQGICPNGWHIPTDDEFNSLTSYLGGASVAGGNMKETGFLHWQSPNAGATNLSGFTALGAGYRTNSNPGSFYLMKEDAHFWSSSQTSTTFAWSRSLDYAWPSAGPSNLTKVFGFSVRCCKN